MKDLHVVVDLQFGSCGKGLLVGYLAEKLKPDTLITAWAPNAGHTYINAAGEKFINIMLPNGIVSPNLKRILIGPGSVINPEIFVAELNRYSKWLGGVDIYIHEHAAVVTDEHRHAEAQYGFAIGSTMKGCGEAVIQKIKRDPAHMNIARNALRGTPLEGYVACVEDYNFAVDKAEVTLLEGAQGFSLGINNGFYPYTTSRECTFSQLMTDCGIPRRDQLRATVYGACRTFPIRVANRFDKDGRQIGTSGPHYWDQEEIEWADIGLEPELTTVTRLPRRIFTWSAEQVKQAIRANGIDHVFLNFANYMKGRDDVMDLCRLIQGYGASVRFIGWGATVNDVEELK